MAADRLVRFSAMAAHLGVSRSYLTELRQAGRLVLSDDGRRCWLQASAERVKATADPSQDATRARHAAGRAGAPDPVPAAQTAEAAMCASGAGEGAGEVVESDDPSSGVRYQDARARKEHYLALQAQRDYERSMGKLVAADEIRHAVANAATTLRVRLETLPSSLAAQLAAEHDEGRVRALLADQIEVLLGELAREFGHVAQEVRA
jgi:hypothetical protein